MANETGNMRLPAWLLLLLSIATWPMLCVAVVFGVGGRCVMLQPALWWIGLILANCGMVFHEVVTLCGQGTITRKSAAVLTIMICGLFLAISLALLNHAPVGRWWTIQRLGYVPEYQSHSGRQYDVDLCVAEWTTWWGDRLDPAEFWNDRVVWNDEGAVKAARSRGRSYPPIPVHIANLTTGFSVRIRSDVDRVPWPWDCGLDGGSIPPYHSTYAESAYWNWFWRTQPKPPETLEREQFAAAERLTEPLTDEQRNAANKWKIAYLQRLRREKVGESYINAYLKAWELTADDLRDTTRK